MEKEIEVWYEQNEDLVCDAWTDHSMEEYGFDVTEWNAWDSCPPDHFIEDMYEANND